MTGSSLAVDGDDGTWTSLGFVVGMSLILADAIAMFTCIITVATGAVLLLASGAVLPLATLLGDGGRAAGEQASSPVLARGTRARDLPVAGGIAWTAGLLGWGSLPVMVVILLKLLAGFGSLGSGLAPVVVGWITIASLAGGTALAATVQVLATGRPVVSRAYTLGSAITFIIFTLVITAGVNALWTRIPALLALPGTVVAVLGARVPLARATGLSILRSLATSLYCILLVAGFIFFGTNAPEVFTWLFAIAGSTWVACAGLRFLPASSAPTVEVDARA